MPSPAYTPPRYSVFISYSRRDDAANDQRWAEWLQKKLLTYSVPPELAGKVKANGLIIPASLYPVFRDVDSLPIGTDLAARISSAIDNSDVMVVLCSPSSRKSKWVRREVRQFKMGGKADRVLVAVLAGVPDAIELARIDATVSLNQECFSRPVRYGVSGQGGLCDFRRRASFDYADFRPEGVRALGFTSAKGYREYRAKNFQESEQEREIAVREYAVSLEREFLSIVAGILEVSLDDLTRLDLAMKAQEARLAAEREKLRADLGEARQRQLRMQNALVAVVAAVSLISLLAFYLFYRHDRAAKAQIANATARENIALKQKVEAAEQREEALRRAGRRLLEESRAHLRTGHWHQAVSTLAQALRFQPRDPDILTEIWNAILVYTGDRIELPDIAYRTPSDSYPVLFAAEATECLLSEGRVGEKQQSIFGWDYASGQRGNSFPFPFKFFVSPDAQWITFPKPIDAAEWGWDIAAFGDRQVRAPEALPLGWLPALELPALDGFWCGDRLLLRKRDQSSARWWDPEKRDWDGPEIVLDRAATIDQVDPKLARVFWHNYSRGWNLFDPVLGTNLPIATTSANTVLISSNGRTVVIRKPQDSPNAAESLAVEPMLQDLTLITLNNARRGVFRAISHSGRYVLEDDTEGHLLLRDFQCNSRSVWAQAPKSPTLHATFEREPRWLFHPRQNELWLVQRGLCAVYRLPCVLHFAVAPEPLQAGAVPGDSIYRFLDLASHNNKPDAIVAACTERDRLNKELDDPTNFADLPTQWKRLLKWWTTKPQERADRLPDLATSARGS